MVDPGDTVTNTLKKEFGEEALNSLEVSPEENKRIQESLEHLFHHGTLVIADYECHNTQNESDRAFSPTPSPGLALLCSVIGTEKLAYKWLYVSFPAFSSPEPLVFIFFCDQT